MSDSGRNFKDSRIALILIGISLWSFLILIRLMQLQVVKHAYYVQQATDNQQKQRTIQAPRGNIYDSHMNVLAASQTVSRAIAEPRRMKDIPEAARQLARILELDAKELLGKMMDPARQGYLVVKHGIDPPVEASIKKLKMDGIYFEDENTRKYPNEDLASHTLGFVNKEGDGGAGIELQYDKQLKGKDGLFTDDIDAHHRSFNVNRDIPPVQGNSLVLSIDKDIQYIADRELEAGVKQAQAQAGTVIVMESETGRILALSNYPQFNCNNYNKYTADFWRNRAVSDAFEPGSTFKVVVATAALEAGLTHPNEMIDCQMGTINIGGHVFHDHKGYGLLSFSQILEFSSNVGAARLGLRLGPQHLHEALLNFGFGSKTGVDLPGEIVGLVRDWRAWSGLSIGAISFGQEVGVTSLQILTAINAIANGGYRVRPSVVDRIINEEDGDLVRVTSPERVRIMSPRTAEAVTKAFEGVVLRGTARRAALEGYRAAGKTGTAQKIVNGRYSNDKYVASFIGFAPLPQPRITVLVQLDEPSKGHYGGDVSAPIFQKIAQEVLMQMRIPPDQTLPLPKFNPQLAKESSEDYLPNATPIQPLTAHSEDSPLPKEQPGILTVQVEGESVALPDFRGLSKRNVLDRCVDIGIRLKAKGSGVAVFQSPPPGTRLSEGETCTVTFAKANIKGVLAASGQRYIAQSMNPPLSANTQAMR
jgi:cell division protein FtsI (penicillin-binding protein 3)